MHGYDFVHQAVFRRPAPVAWYMKIIPPALSLSCSRLLNHLGPGARKVDAMHRVVPGIESSQPDRDACSSRVGSYFQHSRSGSELQGWAALSGFNIRRVWSPCERDFLVIGRRHG